MADIREDGSEVFHYDIPDFTISIRKNHIPAGIKFTNMSIHWHEEIEITYIVSGCVYHQLNGKRVKNCAGEAIYINSKQLHVIEAGEEDCVLYCLIFHPTILCSSNYLAQKYVRPIVENEKLDYFFLKDTDEKHKEVLDRIIRIKELQTDMDCDCELKATIVLYELWLSLYHILPRIEANEQFINEDLHRVQKMLKTIHGDYAENLGLEDICNAGGVGKTKGTKLFCQYLSMTPVEYLINYRLDIASRMLIDTNDSVTDIAFASGFSDSSYFARVFRKRVGIAPLEYRTEMRNSIDEK